MIKGAVHVLDLCRHINILTKNISCIKTEKCQDPKYGERKFVWDVESHFYVLTLQESGAPSNAETEAKYTLATESPANARHAEKFSGDGTNRAVKDSVLCIVRERLFLTHAAI